MANPATNDLGFFKSPQSKGRNYGFRQRPSKPTWKSSLEVQKKNLKRKPNHPLKQHGAAGASDTTYNLLGAGSVFNDPVRLMSGPRYNRRLASGKSFRRKQKFVPPSTPTTPFAPSAPRNTSSFLMRARAGKIDSFVSPDPTTPAVLSTPDMAAAPSYREGLVEEVNKKWGVNGYGSMKGLICLRRSDNMEMEEEEGAEYGEGECDREEGRLLQPLDHCLDQDLARFEMVYPGCKTLENNEDLAETKIQDEKSHIEHLERENLLLKEKLRHMRMEAEHLRQQLETFRQGENKEEEVDGCSADSTEE